jgi:hypothetical protein
MGYFERNYGRTHGFGIWFYFGLKRKGGVALI